MKFLVFQAYIDDSGDKDEAAKVFVLAGYIAPAENWAAFSDEWQELLNMDSPHYAKLSYFKMAEMRSSEGRLQQCSWFYRVIEKHITAAISCVIPVQDLIKAVRSVDWPSYVNNISALENPYFAAFKAITNILAQHQEKLRITEPVDFIFDDNHEKRHTIAAWDLQKLSATPEVRNLMGSTPIYMDDKKVLPLQAADLYANWVRYWETEGISDGIEKLKFPWEVKRDIPRLAITFNEQDFRQELLKGFSPEALERSRLSPEDVSRALKEL